MNLYEILVPTIYGDTEKPIRTKHHKEWDKVVRKIAGGLTILGAGKGQWVDADVVYEERIIPVRIACSEEQMKEIVEFTISHYRQKAVMFFLISDQCFIVRRNDEC